jgi:hypothetical protein
MERVADKVESVTAAGKFLPGPCANGARRLGAVPCPKAGVEFCLDSADERFGGSGAQSPRLLRAGSDGRADFAARARGARSISWSRQSEMGR